MAENLDEGEPKRPKKDRALRKAFELKDPKDDESGDQSGPERKSKLEIRSNLHPFFRDPLLLPKVNRHLRVVSTD